VTVGGIGRAADQRGFHFEAQVKCIQHLDCFRYDFCADTIAGQNRDFHDWVSFQSV
jgi:hypothetical protein